MDALEEAKAKAERLEREREEAKKKLAEFQSQPDTSEIRALPTTDGTSIFRDDHQRVSPRDAFVDWMSRRMR